jgi:hypothetical protein
MGDQTRADGMKEKSMRTDEEDNITDKGISKKTSNSSYGQLNIAISNPHHSDVLRT